jgi:N-carbamoylputrescine amidase
MTKEVNIGLIQMSCSTDLEQNLEKTIEKIKTTARLGAHIVCTQELFKTPYFCQTADSDLFELAERLDENNSTIRVFSELSKKEEIVIIAGLFEKQAPGLYFNSAVVIDADGSYLGKYRKMHIPEDPYYYEKFYFTPGDLGYRVFKTRYANIGVLICWDQWFPEAARLTAMKGADIIFYPTAIGYMSDENVTSDKATQKAWQAIQVGHAIANGCYVAAVNRVGYEGNPDGKGGLDFWGSSFVVDPYGKMLKEASEDREENLVCSIDLSYIDEVRNILSHFFRDRRIDSYGGITKRYLDET